EQRLELSQRVLKGEFFGFVEIGPDMARLLDWKTLFSAPTLSRDRAYIRYQTNHPTSQAFRAWAEATFPVVIYGRLLEGVKKYLPFIDVKAPATDPLPSDASYNPMLVQTLGLSKRDPASGQIKDPEVIQQIATILVPA